MNDDPRQEITPQQREIAEKMLHTLPFAKLIGMRLVDLSPGEAKIRLEIRDDLRQIYGVLHGGVTATLIDTAMAFAAATILEEGTRSTTIDLNVHYLRPHTDGAVIATAKVVRAGKRIITISAEVHNDEGKLIATALSTYTKI